jgi:hypothetical protein
MDWQSIAALALVICATAFLWRRFFGKPKTRTKQVDVPVSRLIKQAKDKKNESK